MLRGGSPLAIGERLEVALAPPEAAAITESLLGLVELNTPVATPDAQVVELVDRLIEAAAARLHVALADDAFCARTSPSTCAGCAFGSATGCPSAIRCARRCAGDIPTCTRWPPTSWAGWEVEGTPIPVEEVGFLTMYLAGSLERHRLQPKVRVTVVCPAGMATVWILVSRLLAEFPQAEVVQVFSKTAFEGASDMLPTDLMISTVPLEGFAGDVPAVVVNPLLLERDVRHLTRYLGLPASS